MKSMIRLLSLALLAAAAGCYSPIIRAVERGDLSAINAQLEQGMDPGAPAYKNASAMQWASSRIDTKEDDVPFTKVRNVDRYRNSLRVMLERCAEIFRQGANCEGALAYAVRHDHLNLAVKLFARGADVNKSVKTSWGEGPPIIGAALWGKVKAVKLLVDNGAKIDLGIAALERGAKSFEGLKYTGSVGEWVRKILSRYKAGIELLNRYRDREARATLRPAKGKIREEERAGDRARKKGNNKEALSHYVAAIQAFPLGVEPDQSLRVKAIAAARSMRKPPALPAEFHRRMARGEVYIEKAKSPSDFEKAVEELAAAVRAAPWAASAYFNLGLVHEKAGNPAAAIRNLKLYLLGAPKARDAAAVQKKIYKLELVQELAQ